MHVASTTLFEGPAPSYEEFRDHIASRLHLVPRFRQKLRFVPFGQGRPVWVDDPNLNLDYHVRHTALPPPGSEEQLRTLAARIFSQRLDRSKPVWEIWLVDGVEGGRFAIVAKTHHCLVDGVSGVDITTVLFDLDREPEPAAPTRSPGSRSPEPCGRPAAGRGADRARHQPGRDRAGRPGAAAGAASGRRCGDRGPRSRRCDRAHRPLRPRLPVQRRDRALPALRLGADRPRGAEADQEPGRRHGQRRRAGGGLGRPGALPASARPLDQGPGAAGDGADQRSRRGRARGARQPRLGDDGAAARVVRGPDRAPAAWSPRRWAT